MTKEKLKQLNELEEIIETTEKGLENLYEIRKSKRTEKENQHYDDLLYTLCISKYSDGSGGSAKLSRYEGNSELLDVIIETLEKQLAKFQNEFDSL